MLDSVNALEVTENSFNSLQQITQDLSMRPLDGIDPRQRTAFVLLQLLHNFAQKQFDFFKKGVIASLTDPTYGFLLPTPLYDPNAVSTLSGNYPIHYPFHVLVNQIASDIEVLTRAINNREDSASTLAMLQQIQLADQLAYAALQPAMAHLSIQPSTALSYFQKSPSVRIIPYALVAMVGIPLKAINNPYDLLAVPHEIGHYVYQFQLAEMQTVPITPQKSPKELLLQLINSNFRDNTLNLINVVAGTKQRECIENWFEEIFADVYGCLIAGPISAIYMQEMLSGLSTTQLTEDDADHPLPALRPFIYTATLKQMAQGKLSEAANTLETQWDRHLELLGTQADFSVRSKQNNALNVQLTITHMKDVTQQIVMKLCQDTFAPLVEAQAQSLDSLWYRGADLEDGKDLQAWRDGFYKFVANEKSYEANYSELQFSSQGSLSSLSPQGQAEPLRKKLLFEQLRDAVMAQGSSGVSDVSINVKNDNGELRQWWEYILDANGWATQGPGPGHVGKGPSTSGLQSL